MKFFRFILEGVFPFQCYWWDPSRGKALHAPNGHEKLVIDQPWEFDLEPDQLSNPRKDAIRKGFLRVDVARGWVTVEVRQFDRKTKEALSDVAVFLISKGSSEDTRVTVNSEFYGEEREFEGKLSELATGELFESKLEERYSPPDDYRFWISPDGDVIDLGSTYHQEYMGIDRGDPIAADKEMNRNIDSGWIRITGDNYIIFIITPPWNRKIARRVFDFLKEYVGLSKKIKISIQSTQEEMENGPMLEVLASDLFRGVR